MSIMDTQKWFSERLNQWVDLKKMPKEELVEEVMFERRERINFEKELLQLEE